MQSIITSTLSIDGCAPPQIKPHDSRTIYPCANCAQGAAGRQIYPVLDTTVPAVFYLTPHSRTPLVRALCAMGKRSALTTNARVQVNEVVDAAGCTTAKKSVQLCVKKPTRGKLDLKIGVLLY